MLKNIKRLGFLQAVFALGLMSFSASSILAADAGKVKQQNKMKKEPKPMKMGTQKAPPGGPAAEIGKKASKPMKMGTQKAPPGGPAAAIGKPAGMHGAVSAGAPVAGAATGVAGAPAQKQSFMGKMAASREQSKAAKAQRNAMLTPEQQLRKDEMRMQNRQLAGGIAMGMTGAAAGLAGQHMANKNMMKQQQMMNQQGQMQPQQQQMMQQPQMQGQMQPQQQQMMQEPME